MNIKENTRYFLFFLLGGILATVLIFVFYKPDEKVSVSELEGEVRGIYGKLIELGYSEDISNDNIKVIVKKIKEASDWVPHGDIEASDVLKGKTFYNNSRELQTGTYVPQEFEFQGNASVEDVLAGKKFYSDSGELLAGTLVLPTISYNGNASVSDVLSGKTFYSNSGTLLTGSYTPPLVSYLGDASVTDVILGKKFYSNSGTLLTGSYTPPLVSYLGDASVTDVILGKKFYSNSGTLLTGTYEPPVPIDFTSMQYSTYDDYAGIDSWGWGGVLTEDYKGEEAEWTKISENIWKDERVGLYWSSDQTLYMRALIPNSNTNNFSGISQGTCEFFNSIPRSSYDGLDVDCGNAINWCATLELDGRSNWYLPSQKELMLGYIDGMYNQAGETLEDAADFTVGEGTNIHYGYYWSSSEASLSPNYAWWTILADGSTYGEQKSNTSIGVRCVSRD